MSVFVWFCLLGRFVLSVLLVVLFACLSVVLLVFFACRPLFSCSCICLSVCLFVCLSVLYMCVPSAICISWFWILFHVLIYFLIWDVWGLHVLIWFCPRLFAFHGFIRSSSFTLFLPSTIFASWFYWFFMCWLLLYFYFEWSLLRSSWIFVYFHFALIMLLDVLFVLLLL